MLVRQNVLLTLYLKNLKKTDNRGSTDAYVEISLLPLTQKPEKTKPVKNSSNPVFNHSVNYEIRQADLMNQTLYLQVFDWDRFSKNDPIGEVKLQLGYLDLSSILKETRALMPYSGKVKLFC